MNRVVGPTVANFGLGRTIAWAWCRWADSAGTPTISEQHNTSSITDNGVGDFTFTWARPFANATYAVVLTHYTTTAGGTSNVLATINTTSGVATTSVKTLHFNATIAAADPAVGWIQAIGEH